MNNIPNKKNDIIVNDINSKLLTIILEYEIDNQFSTHADLKSKIMYTISETAKVSNMIIAFEYNLNFN